LRFRGCREWKWNLDTGCEWSESTVQPCSHFIPIGAPKAAATPAAAPHATKSLWEGRRGRDNYLRGKNRHTDRQTDRQTDSEVVEQKERDT
jgi:hypothetical protein